MWRLRAFMLVVAVLIMPACVSSRGVSLVPASRLGSPVTVFELIARSDDFTVWVFFDPRATALVFDSKGDAITLHIREPHLTWRQVTDPALIRRHAADLDDRLAFPREYVQAIRLQGSVPGTLCGYVYMAYEGGISVRRDTQDPSVVEIVRVLPLERPQLLRPEGFRWGS